MMHPKILIAEGDPLRAKFLQTTLESAGFDVVEARDSMSAWKKIETQELAMALIDTDLPGSSECNVVRCVRADSNLRKLTLVMLGDAQSSEESVAWLNLGADDYLSRSLSSELLKAQVHARLRRVQPGHGKIQ